MKADDSSGLDGEKSYQSLTGAEHRERNLGDNDYLEYEMVRLKNESFDPVRWERAVAHKRRMPRATSFRSPDPGPKVLERVKEDVGGVFLAAEKRRQAKARVKKTRNPAPKASFGFVGPTVSVEADADLIDGTLVLPFDGKQVDQVIPGTIHLFRWEPDRKEFRMVIGSGVNVEYGYAWARIDRPGRYTLIGLHSHPLVQRTVGVFCNLRGLLRMLPTPEATLLRDRICLVILCAPNLIDRLSEAEFLKNLMAEGLAEGDLPPAGTREYPSVGGRDLCDLCTGLPAHAVPPECDIPEEPPTGLGGDCDHRWVSVGPRNLSGAMREVVVDPTDSNRIYAVAWNGGVWLLDDVGRYPTRTWRPLTDQVDNLMMSAMAVAPSDSRVLYAADRSGFVQRSSDTGGSWARTSATPVTPVGLVNKLLVHPFNTDVVFAATDTGFLVSITGGEDWDVLYVSTGQITDAAMDPLNSSIIYICETGVGVLKTYTMGFVAGAWQTVLPWSRATTPISNWIEIDLGYRNADGSLQLDSNRTVVAKLGTEVFVNRAGGRSTGSGWVSVTTLPGNGYGGWCHALAVDPFNPDIVLAGQQELWRIDVSDGSQTNVASFYRPHEDQHDVAFDPNNRGVAYLANDGGVFRSTNGGVTWFVPDMSVDREIAARRSLVKGLTTAEFYRVGVQGERAVGNLFHSGIIASSDLSTAEWEGVEGHAWEWNYIYADPKRPGRFYVFTPTELLIRLYPYGGTRALRPFGRFPPYVQGAGTSTAVGAIAVDTRPDSQTILVGAFPDGAAGTGFRLMMTAAGDTEPVLDAAGNWTGLPVWTAVIDSGSDPIAAVTFAQRGSGRVYAMSRTGRVFRKDEVNAPGAWDEPGRWRTSDVRQIAVNAADSNRLYAVTGRSVARSENGGARWDVVGAATLPPSEFNSIVADPYSAHQLFLGADSGVYASGNDGDEWVVFDEGLPNAEVLQIYIVGQYLYAVTHGRGLWRRRLVC